MTFVILFVLAVAWAWYLLTWLGSRREHSNVNSISTFSKHLSVLERTSPANAGFSTVAVKPSNRGAVPAGPSFRPPAAMTLSQAQIRRRNVLFALGAVSLVTLALAGLMGGVFVPVTVAVDVLLVGYVALLARSRSLQLERAEKVRYLHGEGDWADPDDWWDDEVYADELELDSVSYAR